MANRAQQLRGAAAIAEMLDMIGSPEADDHAVAQVLTENEMDIRALLASTLASLAIVKV